MSEDRFVAMLLAAAGDVVTDQRDIELARSAGAWALRNGWEPYLNDGWVCTRPGGLQFWVDDTPSPGALLISVRLEPGRPWRTHVRAPVADLGQALDKLAGERLLPARFCTLGRAALDDYAEALDRAASSLWDLAHEPGAVEAEGEFYPWEMRIRSATLNQAASRARAFPRAELAVLA